jgi:hypothetical protein
LPAQLLTHFSSRLTEMNKRNLSARHYNGR